MPYSNIPCRAISHKSIACRMPYNMVYSIPYNSTSRSYNIPSKCGVVFNMSYSSLSYRLRPNTWYVKQYIARANIVAAHVLRQGEGGGRRCCRGNVGDGGGSAVFALLPFWSSRFRSSLDFFVPSFDTSIFPSGYSLFPCFRFVIIKNSVLPPYLRRVRLPGTTLKTPP